jgi:hypothetical protein
VAGSRDEAWEEKAASGAPHRPDGFDRTASRLGRIGVHRHLAKGTPSSHRPCLGITITSVGTRVLVVAAVGLAGCGNPSPGSRCDSSAGPDLIRAGTIAFAPRSSTAARSGSLSGEDTILLLVSASADACGELITVTRQSTQVEERNWFQIQFATPVVTGTYTAPGLNGPWTVFATVNHAPAATVVPDQVYSASSGVVALSAFSAIRMAGNYDLTIEGESIVGGFDVPFCNDCQ